MLLSGTVLSERAKRSGHMITNFMFRMPGRDVIAFSHRDMLSNVDIGLVQLTPPVSLKEYM